MPYAEQNPETTTPPTTSSQAPNEQHVEGDLVLPSLGPRSIEDLLSSRPDLESVAPADEVIDPALAEQSVRNLRQLLSTEGSLAALVVQAPRTATHLSPEEVCEALQHGVDTLVTVTELITSVNALGDQSSERIPEAAEQLIPAAIQYINARAVPPGSLPPVTAGEKRLLHAFVRSCGKQVKPAGWQRILGELAEMVERSEALPPPDVYLEASATARAPSAALCAQYRGINDTIEKLRRERGAGNGERISELVTQRDALDPKLDRLLQGVSDTDPHQIPQCWKGVRVQIAPRAPLFDAILQLSQSLGRVIERIAVGEGKDPSEASLPIPSLIRDTKPASPYRIGVTSIDPTLLTQAPDAKRFLPSLLNNFHQLREALTVLYPNLLAAQLRPNPEHRALKSRVEGALGPVFLGDAEKTRAILAALTVSPSAELRSAQTKLLMTRSVNSRDGTFSLTLDRPDNVQLLAQTVQSYLFGSPDERSMVHRALESGSLKPVQGFCSRVQEALSRKQVGTLNRIFDQELVRTTQDPHAGLPELASVLFSLHSLAEEPESRRSLKGRLKNIAQIDHVAKALQNKISGEGSAASIFVEKTRARVARRFLADLNDYWGQEQLVSAMRSIFDGNLNLLRNPKAWAGIPAHKVMKNGILLHGDPGAGKTYLVTCAANEYELPLITITREEMAEAFERAGSTSAGVPGKERKGNDIEGTLATFMDGKLKAAAKEREKSGAIASILFIDEMEAEFLNRDPRTSQRSELTRTNIMLRVIERLITQHADIFFIGATNHIDQVDGAALRPGRFGIHLEVKLPNQEDAEAIVRGSLETLDLSLDPATSSSEAFQELTKECSGLSPHAITLSLNNTVALQRVAGSVTAVNETLLRAMKAAVAETRKQDHRGTLHGRTEPGR